MFVRKFERKQIQLQSKKMGSANESLQNIGADLHSLAVDYHCIYFITCLKLIYLSRQGTDFQYVPVSFMSDFRTDRLGQIWPGGHL